jgi:hypothetical protein
VPSDVEPGPTYDLREQAKYMRRVAADPQLSLQVRARDKKFFRVWVAVFTLAAAVCAVGMTSHQAPFQPGSTLLVGIVEVALFATLVVLAAWGLVFQSRTRRWMSEQAKLLWQHDREAIAPQHSWPPSTGEIEY